MTKTPRKPTGEGDAPLPGQITEPNPIELIWERYRAWILAAAGVAVVLIAGYYVNREMEKAARNRTWTRFARGTSQRSWFEKSYGLTFLAAQNEWGLLDAFDADAARSSIAELDSESARALTRWALAIHLSWAGEVEELEKLLAELPATTDFLADLDPPPIYSASPDASATGASTKDKETKRRAKKPEDVEPPTPPKSNLKDRLLAIAKANAAFRAEQERVYVAPTPPAKPRVRLRTSLGEIVLGLFPELAPEHCARFLKNCKSGVYNGLRFHQIQHAPAEPTMFGGGTEQLMAWFGDPASKNEDRSEWGKFESEDRLGYEESGLSHFPYALAAERQATKTDSDSQLVYFTGSDLSGQRDGDYVVFGRVIEGQMVLEQIMKAELSSSAEEKSGRGRPKTAIVVDEVVVDEA